MLATAEATIVRSGDFAGTENAHQQTDTLITPSEESYASVIATIEGSFDVVAINGAALRSFECAFFALSKISDKGVIIVNNINTLTETATLLRCEGFTQIDFASAEPDGPQSALFLKFPSMLNALRQRSNFKHVHSEFAPEALFDADAYLKAFIYPLRQNKVIERQSVEAFQADFQNFRKRIPEHIDISCGQEGEDIILRRLLKSKARAPGFYVDVGAHHPVRFSNTFNFYVRGWHGINIEPNKSRIELFKRYRPRDINIECGVSDTAGTLDYYEFEESALNTCDAETAEEYVRLGCATKTVSQISVRTLASILAENVAAGQEISFLNIDIEGHEMAALVSSDWEQFRPVVACIEALTVDQKRAITNFMSSVDYEPVAATLNSHFFVDQRVEF